MSPFRAWTASYRRPETCASAAHSARKWSRSSRVRQRPVFAAPGRLWSAYCRRHRPDRHRPTTAPYEHDYVYSLIRMCGRCQVIPIPGSYPIPSTRDSSAGSVSFSRFSRIGNLRPDCPDSALWPLQHCAGSSPTRILCGRRGRTDSPGVAPVRYARRCPASLRSAIVQDYAICMNVSN